MKTCVVALTNEGQRLAAHIADHLDHCEMIEAASGMQKVLAGAWQRYQGIICVMATGIVVRNIAGLLEDKTTDPCVVVVDQLGRHAISLLSGHLGGGNDLAIQVAAICGGTPVITTASDLAGKTALDLWAKRNDLSVSDRAVLTAKSARIVNGESLLLYISHPLEKLPPELVACARPEQADIIISCNKDMTYPGLCCIPRVLYLGIGCNRGTPWSDIDRAFTDLCDANNIDQRAFAEIATIDVKQDEQGILQFAENHGMTISYFSRDQLNTVDNVTYSAAAMKAVGAKGVAEPAALLAAGRDGSRADLVVTKRKWPDVTMAIAQRVKVEWE